MTKPSKSALFHRAWQIVRVTNGNGEGWSFGRALKEAWSELKAGEIWHWATDPVSVAKRRLIEAQNTTRFGSYREYDRVVGPAEAALAAAIAA